MTRQQHVTLKDLRENKNFIIVSSGKNLGPCIIERDRYINLALKNHLLDKKTYKRLTKEEAMQREANAKLLLTDFVARGEREDIFMENEATYFKAVLVRKKTRFPASIV